MDGLGFEVWIDFGNAIFGFHEYGYEVDKESEVIGFKSEHICGD